MSKIKKIKLIAISLALAIGAGGVVSVAQAAQKEKFEQGTVIPVILDDTVSSATAQAGDTISATLRGEEGYQGIPAGSRVLGVVTEAHPQKDKAPGVLDVDFNKLELPRGNTIGIKGSVISLDGKMVQTDSNGRIVAKGNAKKADMKMVGYGAAAGLAWSLLDSGKLNGTKILLGAAAGYGASLLMKNKHPNDVKLTSGSEIGVRVDRDFTVNQAMLTAAETTSVESPVSTGVSGHFSSNPWPDVVYRGKEVSFGGGTSPIKAGESWLLPAASVIHSAGYVLRYDKVTKRFSVDNGVETVSMPLGSRVISSSNGSRVVADAASKIVNGSSFLPVKFIEIATMSKADYDKPGNVLIFDQAP